MTDAARLLALVKAATGEVEWFSIADTVEEVGLDSIYSGEWNGFEPDLVKQLHAAASKVTSVEVERFDNLIARQRESGVDLVTVLDDTYPINLRQIYNRPPFLFVAGDLHPDDRSAVAVVGTRSASDTGLEAARSIAGQLADAGVTVLSGLAVGIDTAAHRAALTHRGRTVAVMGTGINRVYPESNTDLAREIRATGALISQFWPDAPPTRWGFPMRNVVMSGLGVGTVVVEATRESGAKMQARLALEHGKRVFLLQSLVLSQEWARSYAKRPGATVVRKVEDVLAVLEELTTPAEQLRLG